MFMVQLLRSTKISVKYLVMVGMDSVGAIFMASNITTTCCTKYVDIRYKYVNNYVNDEVAVIILAMFADNDSNISPRI